MNANLLKLSPAERAAKLLAFRPGTHNFTMSLTPIKPIPRATGAMRTGS